MKFSLSFESPPLTTFNRRYGLGCRIKTNCLHMGPGSTGGDAHCGDLSKTEGLENILHKKKIFHYDYRLKFMQRKSLSYNISIN